MDEELQQPCATHHAHIPHQAAKRRTALASGRAPVHKPPKGAVLHPQPGTTRAQLIVSDFMRESSGCHGSVTRWGGAEKGWGDCPFASGKQRWHKRHSPTHNKDELGATTSTPQARPHFSHRALAKNKMPSISDCDPGGTPCRKRGERSARLTMMSSARVPLELELRVAFCAF